MVDDFNADHWSFAAKYWNIIQAISPVTPLWTAFPPARRNLQFRNYFTSTLMNYEKYFFWGLFWVIEGCGSGSTGLLLFPVVAHIFYIAPSIVKDWLQDLWTWYRQGCWPCSCCLTTVQPASSSSQTASSGSNPGSVYWWETLFPSPEIFFPLPAIRQNLLLYSSGSFFGFILAPLTYIWRQ